ncbi:MAG: hypothetical protein WBM87_05835 [Woeseiaceae bacterium]
MNRSFSDWGGNIAAFVLVIVFNWLANALPFNDQSQTDIAAKYPSLFTPAGFTFSIWGLIYLALLAFTVYQALPSQRQNTSIKRLSVPFKISCVSNALWLVAWHYDQLELALLIMLVLLGSLVIIYRSLLARVSQSTLLQRVVLHLPFSLYTSWISVATIANISIIQTSYGWDNAVLTAVNWTLLKLAVAGAVGASVVLKTRDAAFVLVTAWAAYGISVKQVATPAIAGAATMLAMLALLLAVREAVARLRATSVRS